MNLTRYSASDQDRWNSFVRDSKNGTFIIDRRFMDYHSDRFKDCSLLFHDGNKVVAVLPANISEDGKALCSHQGLTYGGLIMSKDISQDKVLECFNLMKNYCLSELGVDTLLYKPIPYIYNSIPSDEPLYALFRHNAKLIARGVSQCIDTRHHIPLTESRKSGLRKAKRNTVTIHETKDYSAFWSILSDVLMRLHGAKPVHSAEEIDLLSNRFPDNIRLYGAYLPDGTMAAGAWVFICGDTLHTQYLAATDEGKRCGALDKLIDTIISLHERDTKYFDFGVSTEDGGHTLNSGLAFQKEGFGGRGVCYDCWRIDWNEEKNE